MLSISLQRPLESSILQWRNIDRVVLVFFSFWGVSLVSEKGIPQK